MDKAKLAESYFRQGYNCAQAVALAYHQELQLDEDTIAKMMSSFGGGIGRLREVCGAVSGGVFVLGMLRGYSDPNATDKKASHYQLVQDFARAFKERNNSIICKELLGIDCDGNPIPTERTDAFYAKRPCAMMVADAADIVETMLADK